jgi:hypothetical protein
MRAHTWMLAGVSDCETLRAAYPENYDNPANKANTRAAVPIRTPARWHTGADHYPFGEYSLDHPQQQK